MAEKRRTNKEDPLDAARLQKRVRELEAAQARKDEALSETEERLRLFYVNSPLGMGFINLDGVLTECNEALSAILGTPKDQLIGFPMRTGITNEALAVALARAFSGEAGAFEGDYTVVTSGKRTVLRSVFSPLLSGDGKLKGVLFLCEDISERKRTEERLREKEEKYRVLFESANDGIFIHDESGFVDCNSRGAEMYGLPKEKIIGRSPGEFAPERQPDGRLSSEVAAEKIRAALGGVPQMFEWQPIRADGTPFDVEITLSRIELDGKTCLQAIVRDIGDRKKAETALRASEERWRSLVETSAAWIWETDADVRHMYTNAFVTKYLGYRPDEFLQLRTPDMVHPDDLGVVERIAANAARGEGWSGQIIRWRHKDGSWRYIETSGTAVFDQEGRFAGLRGVDRDVSDRVQAEAALRESEGRFRALFENVSVVALVMDPSSGRILDANAAAAAYYGWPQEKLRTMQVWDINTLPRDEILRRMDLVKNRKKDSFLLQHRRADGSVRDVEVHSGPIPFQGGTALYSVVHDVTERRRAEEALLANEARYRRLYNETPVMLHSIDRNGVLVDVNDHWLRTMGYGRGEVIGRKITDFYTDASKKYALEVIQPRFFRTGSVKDAAYQFIKKGGEVLDVVLTATGERDSDGNVIRSQAVIVDVTERKRADEQIRRFSKDLQRLLKVTRDMTATTDLDRLYRNAVQTAAEMLRFDFSSVMLLSEDKSRLTIVDAVGFPPSMIGQYFLLEGQGLSTYVATTRKAGVVPDFRTETRFEVPSVVSDRGIRSALCVPMMIGDSVFGVLIGHSMELREFTAEDIAIYENIGNQAAIAIKSAMNLQALGASERMLQTIIDAEPECVKLLDRDGNLILMNRAGLEMIQAETLEQVKGQCVCPMIGADDWKPFMDLTRRVFRGESGTLAFEMTGLKGRHLWLETHAVPLRNEKDEIIALLGVTRDITERRRIDEALRASEARFRAIIENAVSGILLADASSGKFLYANAEICRMLGYGCDELQQLDVPAIHPAGEMERVQKAFAAQEGTQTLCRRKDGTVFPVEIRTARIELDGRQCLAGFFTDISEKRLLEEERLKIQKLESVGTLAGGIAHDFNNLLQGVFGYISMAKRSLGQRERADAFLEQAENALHQSVNLTTQLLTFSKGGKPVRKRLVLGPVIENGVRFALSGSQLTYRIDLAQDLLPVEADEGQLGQVLHNVVLNADQAMPLGGRIEVAARNVPASSRELPPGLSRADHVRIDIRDHGTGIPAEYLPRIFDPYFTTKEKGSGLGLATSYAIVRNHGGMIVVSSEPGKGSTFSIFLPASARAPGSPSGGEAPAGTRHVKVLVMDDEEIVRNVAVELLHELGHDVECAEHGAAALDAYRKAKDAGRPFDIVILDLTIRGGMGGMETLRRLRDLDPQVKAVVSSGYSDDEAVSDFTKLGFSSFLKKPYDMSALREMLHALTK